MAMAASLAGTVRRGLLERIVAAAKAARVVMIVVLVVEGRKDGTRAGQVGPVVDGLSRDSRLISSWRN